MCTSPQNDLLAEETSDFQLTNVEITDNYLESNRYSDNHESIESPALETYASIAPSSFRADVDAAADMQSLAKGPPAVLLEIPLSPLPTGPRASSDGPSVPKGCRGLCLPVPHLRVLIMVVGTRLAIVSW